MRWCLLHSPHHPSTHSTHASLISTKDLREQVGSMVRGYFALHADSVSNSTMLWNAHKSVVGGALLKLGAQERKKCNATLNTLLDGIKSLEMHNKQAPSEAAYVELCKVRSDLSLHLQGGYVLPEKT